jgi:hypothetical protein
LGVYVCVCVHVYVCVCLCVQVIATEKTRAHSFKSHNWHAHTRTHTSIQTYMHTYIRTHKTHTQTPHLLDEVGSPLRLLALPLGPLVQELGLEGVLPLLDRRAHAVIGRLCVCVRVRVCFGGGGGGGGVWVFVSLRVCDACMRAFMRVCVCLCLCVHTPAAWPASPPAGGRPHRSPTVAPADQSQHARHVTHP